MHFHTLDERPNKVCGRLTPAVSALGGSKPDSSRGRVSIVLIQVLHALFVVTGVFKSQL